MMVQPITVWRSVRNMQNRIRESALFKKKTVVSAVREIVESKRQEESTYSLLIPMIPLTKKWRRNFMRRYKKMRQMKQSVDFVKFMAGQGGMWFASLKKNVWRQLQRWNRKSNIWFWIVCFSPAVINYIKKKKLKNFFQPSILMVRICYLILPI